MKTIIKLYLIITCLNLFGNTPIYAQLVNPNSTEKTKALFHFIDSVSKIPKIISGQCDDKYLEYIETATNGKLPAMVGYDFNGICPSQNGNVDAEKAIKWVNEKKGIAQFQWHWISPNGDGDFYTKNFDLKAALADKNSQSYINIIRDIDLVAAEIKKMQDADVPILWRPLHEAEGKWFWWGMSEGEDCIELWRLIYDRYVNYHKLNNLIWVWTSYGTDKENWYPGDDVVDMIVWDYPNYNNANSWNQYQELFAGKGKIFGIGEDGKLTNPDVLETQPWSYFLTWAYMINDNNSPEWINQVYNDNRVITLDDMTPGPKAKAGQAQLVFDNDGNGFETVTLDGSNSTTDLGTIDNYIWSIEGDQIATGEKPTVELPLGVNVITLTISTSENETSSANVTITIKQPSLSTNKEVTVSSTEDDLGNVAANAVDGDESTRWSSKYSDPQWFIVDLGESYQINEIVLQWEDASAKEYKLEISDNKNNWTKVIEKKDMPAGARIDIIKDFTEIGRYVRMFGYKRNTQYGYSLFEFEIYGNKVSTGTKIETNEKKQDVRIYPTRIKQFDSLQISLKERVEKGTIVICNMNGQIVKKINMNSNAETVIIDNSFKPGIYLINIDSNNINVQQKFIVE